jgi:hypothetical protein
MMGAPTDEASKLKDQGNNAFRNQEWDKALDFYTKAIEAYNAEPSFYTNRAQVPPLPVCIRPSHLLTASRHTSSSSNTATLYKMPTRQLSWTQTMSRYCRRKLTWPT